MVAKSKVKARNSNEFEEEMIGGNKSKGKGGKSSNGKGAARSEKAVDDEHNAH